MENEITMQVKKFAPVLASAALVASVVGGSMGAVRLTSSPASAGTSAADRIRQELLRHDAGAPLLITSHRGDWRSAPENSVAGLDSAIRRGADLVEIDLQKTSDGQLVLMHDDTVDRTTDGTGRVADLTLAQIEGLHLQKGLGGNQAPVTAERVPTLEQALRTTRGRALVNLDKAWAYRDQIYQLLVRLDMVDEGLFKSSADVAEVEAFLAQDPKILYSHVVDDANAASVGAFTGPVPQVYELIFDRLTDAQIQPSAVAKAEKTSRIFVNTMWRGLAAGYTDEASLRDPALGWATVVDRHHADILQTDNIPAMVEWRAARAKHQTWPRVPANTVRVQAEDYSTDGKDVGYHDTEDANQGGAARTYEGVDIGDNEGAICVDYIRQGEWIRYSVQVPATGRYQVRARVSSPYSPAGRFSLDFLSAGTGPSVDVPNTTSHSAFEMVDVETRTLTKGRHDFVLRVDASAYQNWNLDYLDFARI